VKIKFSIAINVEFQPKAIALIVNGFSKDVLNKLPMEFAVEAQKLLEISLEGSVG
jgi:Fe-S cluster assembly protein SufB